MRRSKDPYAVVECGNRKCRHFMAASTYRNIIFPDGNTLENHVHLIADGSLPSPQFFGCPCGHFTIVGRPEHIDRFAKQPPRQLKGSQQS